MLYDVGADLGERERHVAPALLRHADRLQRAVDGPARDRDGDRIARETEHQAEKHDNSDTPLLTASNIRQLRGRLAA